ncbi:MAG: hypothetical protein JWO76_1996 [Nocardioides sp.]|nr:hypothetical protein [Nocardioides sp.]
MSVGDVVGVDGRLALDVEDGPDGEVGLGAEHVADPGLGHRTDALHPGDPGGLGAGVHVDEQHDGGQQRGRVDRGGFRMAAVAAGLGRLGGAPGGVLLEELHGLMGVGEDQHGEHPALVERGVVAQGLERVGEVGDGGVELGDDRERGTDVEAAHAVLGGTSGVGVLVAAGAALALRSGLGVGGGDGALHQGLEAAPRDPAVGGLDDA